MDEFRQLSAALQREGTAGLLVDSLDPLETFQSLGPSGVNRLALLAGCTTNQHFILQQVQALETTRGAIPTNLTRSFPKTGTPRTRSEFQLALVSELGQRMLTETGNPSWEISLPAPSNYGAVVAFAQELRNSIPTAIVKLSFTPNIPGLVFLIRRLERLGIPVNVTGMFSARQVMVVAILANPTRASIFVGRINRAVGATALGQHVAHSAQHVLREERELSRTKTLMIAAGVPDHEVYQHLIGCDLITASPSILATFLDNFRTSNRIASRHAELAQGRSRGYASSSLVPGAPHVEQLFQFDDGLLSFLRALRLEIDTAAMDTETLLKRFTDAGFGNLFYEPNALEWQTISHDRVPAIEGELARRVAFDTLLSLHAMADFNKAEDKTMQMLGWSTD